jgi:hypothetical protein
VFLGCGIILDNILYIDLGTGSILFQILVGGLVGVGVAAKVYFYKIKLFLKR